VRLETGVLAEQLRPLAEKAQSLIRAAGRGADREVFERVQEACARFLGIERARVVEVRVRVGELGAGADVSFDVGAVAPVVLELRPAATPGPAYFRTEEFAAFHCAVSVPTDSTGRLLEAIKHRTIARARHDGPSLLRSELDTATKDLEADSEPLDELPSHGTTRLLERMIVRYQGELGASPELYRHRRSGTLSLEVPREHVADDAFFRLPERVRTDATSARYLRRLGWGWTSDGVVRRVPLPASHVHAVEAVGLGDFGFRPRAIAQRMPLFAATRWARDGRRARIPVDIGPSAPPQTLAIVMSMHVLPSHLVPRAVLFALGERIATALGSRFSLRRRLRAPERLSLFYKDDLFVHCRSIYAALGAIEDFPLRFIEPESLANLFARLESRLHQL
jgi:hypothetical protein